VHDGRGWFYDEPLVKDLKRIYYPSEKNDASDAGDATATEKPHEVCKFCGKPIASAIHDWIGPDLNDPAHCECAEKWRQLNGDR